MKTVFTYLVMLALPAAIAAQPIENHGEYYQVGDVLTMVDCNISGVTAGPSGVDVNWDFSGLTSSGSLSVTRYTTETSSVFLTSNIVAHLPNGLKRHEQENNTDTYINGIEDSVSGVITYYRSYPVARRPMSYGSYYVDTLAKTVPSTGEHGTGYLTVTGDAYGTLKLPTGTFSNVVRVKKYIYERDSLGDLMSPTIIITNSTSYLWFDTSHRAPLMRIDSLIGTTAETVTVMFLASTNAVGNVSVQNVDFTANLHDNELLLRGRFDPGAAYDVIVYNIIGSQIFTGTFSTPSDNYRFDISREVAPGIYIVNLMQKNDPASKRTVKVVKQ